MKIKNMKLMLLGLLAMGSMNAFAAVDEDSRSVNGILYKMETNADKSKTATVLGVNSSATDAQMATIAIPAEVAGEYGTYKVTAITAGWEKAAGCKDVTAKTKTLSIDVTNLTAALADDAFSSFTKLESLTITDSNAADKAKTKEFKGGFSADAKKTLKTVDFSGSNISKIGDQAFEDCIALTGFNFAKVTEIGASAFKGCYGFTELTIPNTVKVIGGGAFEGMYKEKEGDKPAKGLQTLTFNANDAITSISNDFENDALLKSITINAAKATSIAEGTFTAATELATLTLNMPLLTSIDGVFAAAKFATVDIENTALTTIEDLELDNAHQTLATIKLPKTLASLQGGKFADCVALTAIDLSNTKVTVIPDGTFEITGAEKGADKKAIAPKLASVKLNAKTTEIGEAAFQGQSALATIEGLNQGDLTTIGEGAFNKAGLTAVDLSGATKLKEIPYHAFANMATVTSIKLNKAIEDIEGGAFANDANVASINLGDLEKLEDLNPIFHDGVVGDGHWEYDEDGYREWVDDSNGAKEVSIALTSVTLPKNLKYVNAGALQLLDIEEITIPSSVQSVEERALQGCIYLKTFTWTDCQAYRIAPNTFLGTDKLENVYFMGDANPEYMENALNDYLFFGNDKEVLTVHVTAEVYAILNAHQNWNANSIYSTLVGEGETDLTFDAKGKTAAGYWRTYLIPDVDEEGDWVNASGTWIKADGVVKVYGAVIEGSKVVLKEYGVENEYYKIYPGEAVVLLSQAPTAKIELKYLGANKWNSTRIENALTWSYEDTKASRLKYQYKLGAKEEGDVKFWRVSSGTIKKFVPYLETNGAQTDEYRDREFLDIVFDSEATAIKGINKAGENNGAIYNLQGVRVNKAQKGLYIQDGKKYIMK